jgi:hypothetical protein
MLVCIHEDRVEHLVGMKLAILSLRSCCPTLNILISVPHPPADFRTWIATLPNLQLLDDPALAGLGWNIKPTLLLHCLAEGYTDVLWMDADIIVNRDFRPRFASFNPQTLVIAPEYYWGPQQGGTHRARTWGLQPGRSLPATANTGIIRVTAHHVDLLKDWKTLLNHPAYREAQSRPAGERPVAMISDQEVLTALLGSAAFANLPIEFLERGTEIAQCCGAAGYTPAERLHSLIQNPPLFIHAIGGKPWRRACYLREAWQPGQPQRERMRAYYEYLNLELSPYLAAALPYRQLLGEDASWMDLQSLPAKLLRALFAEKPALQGIPLALLEAVARRLRYWLNGDQYRFSSQFCLQSSPFP